MIGDHIFWPAVHLVLRFFLLLHSNLHLSMGLHTLFTFTLVPPQPLLPSCMHTWFTFTLVSPKPLMPSCMYKADIIIENNHNPNISTTFQFVCHEPSLVVCFMLSISRRLQHESCCVCKHKKTISMLDLDFVVAFSLCIRVFFARRHILSPVKTVRSNLHCKTTLQQKPVGRVTRWMPLTPLGQCKFGCSAPQDRVGRPPAHEGVIYAIYHESWMCIRNCKQNLANRGYFRRWSGWIS